MSFALFNTIYLLGFMCTVYIKDFTYHLGPRLVAMTGGHSRRTVAFNTRFSGLEDHQLPRKIQAFIAKTKLQNIQNIRMALNVGDQVCIYRGSYKGHFGVITGSTLFSWKLVLDLRLRRRWGIETADRDGGIHLTLRKTSIREPTPDEARANETITAPQQRAAPNAQTAAPNDDEEVEVQLLARLVALRLSDDDRRFELFLDELNRRRGAD